MLRGGERSALVTCAVAWGPNRLGDGALNTKHSACSWGSRFWQAQLCSHGERNCVPWQFDRGQRTWGTLLPCHMIPCLNHLDLFSVRGNESGALCSQETHTGEPGSPKALIPGSPESRKPFTTQKP